MNRCLLCLGRTLIPSIAHATQDPFTGEVFTDCFYCRRKERLQRKIDELRRELEELKKRGDKEVQDGPNGKEGPMT